MYQYPKFYIEQCPFSQLLLTWRPKPGVRRIHIGTIELSQEGDVSFSYEQDGLGQTRKYGLTHYPGLPNVGVIDGKLALDLFLRRVINTERNDAKRLLSFWEITPEMFDNKLYLLGATSGRMHSDEFELLPVLEAMNKPYTFITDIAGLKYYDFEKSHISQGSVLGYICEGNNEYDSNAVQVKDEQGNILGYIKQGINKIFKEVSPRLTVAKLIPSPQGISDVYIQISVPAKKPSTIRS